MARFLRRLLGACIALLVANPALATGEPASPGCGKKAPTQPGTSADFTMQVGKLERQYRVHLPPSYSTAFAFPLVLDFHGYTGSAAAKEDYSRLSIHADTHGYIVVYPQGTGFEIDGRLITSWNDGAGNASPGPVGPICADDADKYPHPPECGDPTPCNWATCHDDLGFVTRLLDHLEATLCIDRDRVYATGMSNGGMFVHRLGCAMPERFAAIAPVGGTLARGFACAPMTPLAMMNIYGKRDDYVSQKGVASSDGYFYESAEAVLGKWAEAQGCASESTQYMTSRTGQLGIECIQHANCTSDVEVVHCDWDGAHDWPQSETSDAGNDLIWAFFEEHRRTR